MADTTYRSKVAITTLPLRKVAYERLTDLFSHLHNLNLNLKTITVRPDFFVDVVLNNPMPQEQIDHLGLMGPI